MTALGVRRDKAAFSSGCKPHPATAPAESNRSSQEVTNWLKPVSRIGDTASVQAATNVNAEQISKKGADAGVTTATSR
jgi:negative regulator of sigma E activity